MRRARRTGDRGETMVELLVAVVIMSTAVIAVVGGLGTAIVMSDIHRKYAVIAAQLNAYAAAIESGVLTSPGYHDCAQNTDFASFTPVAGYALDLPIHVSYWDGSNFVDTCTTDTGVQRVTIGIHSTDRRASRSMNVVVRRPCRPADSLCG